MNVLTMLVECFQSLFIGMSVTNSNWSLKNTTQGVFVCFPVVVKIEHLNYCNFYLVVWFKYERITCIDRSCFDNPAVQTGTFGGTKTLNPSRIAHTLCKGVAGYAWCGYLK